jgi:hypothetical protein
LLDRIDFGEDSGDQQGVAGQAGRDDTEAPAQGGAPGGEEARPGGDFTLETQTQADLERQSKALADNKKRQNAEAEAAEARPMPNYPVSPKRTSLLDPRGALKLGIDGLLALGRCSV